MDESLRVIRRPKFALPDATITWWGELLVSDTRVIQPDSSIDFPRDCKDARFLACSASGSADYLITGDGDFTDAQTLVATRIISARGFAKEVMG
uniref:Putative toxin-antitoxin system toxin component, PIN family n=1 Tax=Candidatus Kentrum eta TaxID=2126337 RepID=A0A450V445_9GAMM|nr:MAG: putative toxin-antitoxin system toxin component, PIN family [Candidatus Kentron sp. H]VFJ99674.1 MAG: putative toxin-antitoxin system toxin component, PIN family [Candidatus Kentron sp. H]VFK04227.1 MAG: putative toxin-antitoxin system toxin component, PIN family [Candidatus Kentron sp. H]